MAAEKKPTKIVKRVSFVLVHKFSAALSILAFAVILVSGLMAEVRITVICYRAFVVILVIGLISRVVVSILSTYEEINSGKA